MPDAAGGAISLLLLGECSSLADDGAASGCGTGICARSERSSFVQLCSSLTPVSSELQIRDPGNRGGRATERRIRKKGAGNFSAENAKSAGTQGKIE